MKNISKLFYGLMVVVVLLGTVGLVSGASAVDKIDICHKTGNSWEFMTTPAGPSLDGHLGHGDYYFDGDDGLTDEEKIAWCIENAPEPDPVDVCPNVDGIQEEGPCADELCEEEGGAWNEETQTCEFPDPSTPTVTLEKSVENLGYNPTWNESKFKYTINWSVSGGDVTDLVITDPLPSGTYFLSALVSPAVTSTNPLTWDFDGEVAGASGTITFSIEVSHDQTCLVENTASASYTYGDNESGQITSNTTSNEIEDDHCLPPPPPTDVCPNLEDIQTEVPPGYHLEEGDCVQDQNPPIDMCLNLEGTQTEVPQGYHLEGEGNCVQDSTPTVYECSDGIDNSDSEDDLIDYPADPGCDSAQDNDETNQGSGGGGGGGGGGSSSGSSPRFLGQVLGATTDVCDFAIDTYMRKGYRNNSAQVSVLQALLNKYVNAGLTIDGFYGARTEAGVNAFQLKYKDFVLTPWNLTAPTGIFYKTTLTQAKNLECPEVLLPIPSPLVNWSKNFSELLPALN